MHVGKGGVAMKGPPGSGQGSGQEFRMQEMEMVQGGCKKWNWPCRVELISAMHGDDCD